MARDGLRVDFRNDEWDLRVHAEGTRVVDDDGTGLYGSRSELLARSTAGKQSDLDVLKESSVVSSTVYSLPMN